MDIFISLAIIAGVGFGVYKLFRYSQARTLKQQADAAALARKHGWRYQGNPGKSFVYRVTGTTSGVTWQLVADQDLTSAETSSSTTWSTHDITYHDLVGFIRTRKGFEVMQSMWARAITDVLGAMLDTVGLIQPQHSEVAQTGTRLRSHRPAIDEHFVAIVRPNHGLDNLLTPELESALQAWHDADLNQAVKDSLSIDIGQSNLRVYCRWILEAEYLERFVALGVATAVAIKEQKLPAGPVS
jgi:hypothetical protein